MSNSDNVVTRRADPAEVTAKFQGLVQSPLRAAILRFLCSRPDESFDVESLMQTFGRMRLDVENCIRELAAFGLAHRISAPSGVRYAFAQPDSDALRDLLDRFLERRATVSHEDRSPAVQRFREMIGRDEKMLVVFEWIRTAAKSDISVLILGPTGSGKEVVARMIHELSRRGTNKFQAVNCATRCKGSGIHAPKRVCSPHCVEGMPSNWSLICSARPIYSVVRWNTSARRVARRPQ